MSDTLTHDVGAFIAVRTADDAKAPAPEVAPAEPQAPPPVGYRWISKRWRVLPDGTRDYAAYHGKTAFSFLLPVSSRLRTHRK